MNSKYIQILEQKLEELNAEIDAKIVCGIGYSDDSRRHRMLRDVIRKVKNERRTKFIDRAIRFASIFV